MEFVKNDSGFQIYKGKGAIVVPVLTSLILLGFILYAIIDNKINGVFWCFVCLFLFGVWATYSAIKNRNEPLLVLNDKGIKSHEGFHMWEEIENVRITIGK